jgi:hypothetical protein
VGESTYEWGATYPGYSYFTIDGPSVGEAVTLQHLRICYAGYGLHMYGQTFTLSDAQFVHCYVACQPEYADCYLNNVLISDVETAFGSGAYYTVNGTHLTIADNSGPLTSTWDDPGDCGVFLTNSLLVNIASSGPIAVSTNYTATLASSAGIFQIVGGGSYYLETNSPYRNVGTTNIDPTLLVNLRTKTTYPPIVYSNTTISVATTLSPQAQRDTDTPDLGYHYEPLDYVFGYCTVSSNLAFTAGTSVGFFNDPYAYAALLVGDSVTVNFAGTATAPCRWSVWDTVQEGGNGVWQNEYALGGIVGDSFATTAPAVTANFTICSALANEVNFFRDGGTLLTLCATNSEFWIGNIGGYYSSFNFVNCLIVKSLVGLWWNYGDANLSLQGCTMIGGFLYADHDASGDWPVTVVNCAFEGTAFYMNPHSNSDNGYYSDYNTFLSGADQTYMAGSHDLILTDGYNWQSSWLGDFYLPDDSPLIDAGSTNANWLGLYHFTTQVYQGKETNSIVDIGYHYVAVDYYTGLLIDTDGDGTPDYLEDANGDGAVNSGETDWQNAVDLGFRVRIARPRYGNSLP